MINGPTGELLTSTGWDRGQTISRTIRYTIPSNVADKYASVVAMVYKVGATLNTSEIQQAEKWKLLDSTATSLNNQIGPVTDFKLFQNYPNPFNPTTNISYQSPENGLHILKVFNVLGKEISVLVNEYRSAGKYSVEFDASELPSGVYYYQLIIGEYSQTRKMQLLR
jgi:hypothetical protein